jgi:hypothetical protein
MPFLRDFFFFHFIFLLIYRFFLENASEDAQLTASGNRSDQESTSNDATEPFAESFQIKRASNDPLTHNWQRGVFRRRSLSAEQL